MTTEVAQGHDPEYVASGKCGRFRKQGRGPCGLAAGWGTTHVGEGPCRKHGGKSSRGDQRYKTLRYAKLKSESIRKLAEQFENDPDPLNLVPELAQHRALYAEYLRRCEEGKLEFDPKTASGLLQDLSRAAKRIEDARASNAVSRAELFRLLGEMARVVNLYAEEFIPEPEVRGQFLKRVRESWQSIRLA